MSCLDAALGTHITIFPLFLSTMPDSSFPETKKLIVDCVSGSSCCSKVLVGSTGQARVDQALYMGIYARSLFWQTLLKIVWHTWIFFLCNTFHRWQTLDRLQWVAGLQKGGEGDPLHLFLHQVDRERNVVLFNLPTHDRGPFSSLTAFYFQTSKQRKHIQCLVQETTSVCGWLDLLSGSSLLGSGKFLSWWLCC